MAFKPIQIGSEEVQILEDKYGLQFDPDTRTIHGTIRVRATALEYGGPIRRNPEREEGWFVDESYPLTIELDQCYPPYANQATGTPLVKIDPAKRAELAKQIEGESKLHMHIEKNGSVCICGPTREITDLQDLMNKVVYALYFTSCQAKHGLDPGPSYKAGTKGLEEMMQEAQENPGRYGPKGIGILKKALRKSREVDRGRRRGQSGNRRKNR